MGLQRVIGVGKTTNNKHREQMHDGGKKITIKIKQDKLIVNAHLDGTGPRDKLKLLRT